MRSSSRSAYRSRSPLVDRATQERADSRDELDDGEGLGEIVVRSRLQSLDAVVDLLQRGQHQDRHAAPGADLSTGTQTVEVRHQDVQDDEVGARPVAVEEVQRLRSVRGALDGVALQLERTADRPPQRVVVVDHEDTCTATDAVLLGRSVVAWGGSIIVCARRCDIPGIVGRPETSLRIAEKSEPSASISDFLQLRLRAVSPSAAWIMAGDRA